MKERILRVLANTIGYIIYAWVRVNQFIKGEEVRALNLNDFARKITLREGGKKSVSIAQVKEILTITLTKLAQMEDKEVLKVVHRYKGRNFLR